jgi:hypothetical protein
MYSILSLNEGAKLSGLQSIGLVTYFTMIQAVILSSMMLKDREQGIELRVLVSPHHEWHIYLGMWLTPLLFSPYKYFFFVWFFFVFGDDIGMPFPGLLMTLCTFNVLCVGFAFLSVVRAILPRGKYKANMLVWFESLGEPSCP